MSATPTPTPRTDQHIRCNTGNGREYVRADFARQLETELAAATRERDRLRNEILEIIKTPDYTNPEGIVWRLKKLVGD